eukprot:CAMPEP_0203963850 /NCGR_PEP_ID=MMETSP0359-20131031/93719_1 /ASSEMBLY_ACC=CAM_ASM_000338 /TAXON_ID=268821 /ORGANISM="Scrippsiella Hangoei, Strain SHTV-5" /LENGTH=79 /DNA_ID=CAMNT_0050899931 /DNA_START=69 /DNA_END=304 /DNA_ORIENTATION=+
MMRPRPLLAALCAICGWCCVSRLVAFPAFAHQWGCTGRSAAGGQQPGGACRGAATTAIVAATGASPSGAGAAGGGLGAA